MSYPVYYVPAGDVLPLFFSSYGKTNGESITLTGLAVTDIEIYKDGGTTQRASDAGYTLLDTDGIDFDGITGIHGFSIDTGDNTDAGFYTVGAWFHVVVSAVTVDSQTVNFIAAAFRIMPAESVAGKPKVDVDAWLGTAAATPTVAGVPEVDVTHFNGTAGTFASGRPEVNTSHIAGSAVSTSSAQIGVNVVNAGGTAWGSGAITAASIAADAIGASELAADAVAEIADAVWDEARAGHVAAGSFGEGVASVQGSVSGNVDGQIGGVGTGGITSSSFASGAITAASIAADAIGASELAADAVAEIADAVWDEDATAHQTQGTFGQAIGDPVADTNTIFKAVVTDATGATVGVDAAAILDDTGTAGVVVASGSKTGYSLTATTGLGNQTADITGSLSGSVGSVTGAVGSVTGNVGGNVAGSVGSLTTNNDKTGYSLSSAGVQAIWDALTSALTTAGSVGALVVALGTRLGAWTGTGVNTVLGAFKALLSKTASTPSDIGGTFDATTDSTEAIRDRGDAGWTTATGFSTLDAAGVRTAVGLGSANLDTQLDALPTNAELATALAAADDAVLAAIAALENLSAAEANAEVVDAIATDARGEPGQGAPPASASLALKIDYLYKALRNKKTQTASEYKLFADDGSTVDQKATVSSDGTTTTVGELATGA